MSEVMVCRLSAESPPAQWGLKALVSADDVGLVVHRGSDAASVLRRIQQAGRRIAGLGVECLQLVGAGWDRESQWALGQGFADPRGGRELRWAELPSAEIRELENRSTIAGWVKDVTNATPEDLSPVALAERAAAFLETVGGGRISHRVIVGDALREAGLVGIHGVGRGSDRPPALLELRFLPSGESSKPAAALVGKGITFDSGGYSIKTSEGMLTMKGDMGGAAMVTGGLALAVARGLNRPVNLYLCCAENLVSGHAYKLGDILNYRNGASVEVVNTDAEGRLVLADGLILATESGAPLVIDAATLTGAAHIAVGDECNAVFCPDDALRNRMLGYATDENEAFWPLPLMTWHRDACPSPYADTANSMAVKGGGAGGASNAAGFLSRFAPAAGAGWAHIDLAGAFQKRESKLWAAGATAMGMRTIARTLLEELS